VFIDDFLHDGKTETRTLGFGGDVRLKGPRFTVSENPPPLSQNLSTSSCSPG
jgi:hypothetical protein